MPPGALRESWSSGMRTGAVSQRQIWMKSSRRGQRAAASQAQSAPPRRTVRQSAVSSLRRTSVTSSCTLSRPRKWLICGQKARSIQSPRRTPSSSAVQEK